MLNTKVIYLREGRRDKMVEVVANGYDILNKQE